jgi:hypothetical protein
MNKSIVFEQLQQSKDDLIAQYEQLRKEALNTAKLSVNYPPGFAIVLHRGIARWLDTCLCSALLDSKPNNIKNNHSALNEISIHKEAMVILTNMVLSYHKSGNFYA